MDSTLMAVVILLGMIWLACVGAVMAWSLFGYMVRAVPVVGRWALRKLKAQLIQLVKGRG